MGSFEELPFSAENFPGKVRLFPLPNLVLFPHVMQPLHIFEPRYRAMIEEALAGDGLIAMAVLAPGWEADYDGRPPIHRMACLGRVASSHRLEDGTYNVLLLGLCRVRIVAELPPEKSFREAEAVVCEDCRPPHAAAEAAALHRRMRDAFLKIAPRLPEAQEQLDQILGDDVPLGGSHRRDRLYARSRGCREGGVAGGVRRTSPRGVVVGPSFRRRGRLRVSAVAGRLASPCSSA